MTGRKTATRDRILRFVGNFSDEHGYRPTVREIGHAVGLRSTSTVYGHLQRLQRDGLLTLSPLKPRSVVPTSPTDPKPAKRRKNTKRYRLESDDGCIAYIDLPIQPGMPEGFCLAHYTDINGSHNVVKFTECK